MVYQSTGCVASVTTQVAMTTQVVPEEILLFPLRHLSYISNIHTGKLLCPSALITSLLL